MEGDLHALELQSVFGADDEKGQIRSRFAEAFGRFHEYVKPAHHFEAAGDIGDDFVGGIDFVLLDDALPRPFLAVIDGRIDAVQDSAQDIRSTAQQAVQPHAFLGLLDFQRIGRRHRRDAVRKAEPDL